MFKRKLCSLSAGFVLGIAAAEYGWELFWRLAALYGAAWAYSVWRCLGGAGKKPAAARIFWLSAMAAAVFLGSGRGYFDRAVTKAYEERLKDNAACLLQGIIYKKETKKETYLYYLKRCGVQLGKERYSCRNVLVSLEEPNYSIGEILLLKGNIKLFLGPFNEGNYDEKAYYKSLKTDFKVLGERVVSVHGKRDAFREWLFLAREKLLESYQKAVPKADAGVLAAMVLGDKSGMDDGRKRLYQAAGISHFYSISGLHISLIGMVFYRFLRKRGLSFFCAGGMAAAVILAYGNLIGFGVSAVRAIGMFLLLMYAGYRGRSYDRPTALAFMAAVMAGENPGLLCHAGYLLSFGAVAGAIMAQGISEGNGEEGVIFKIRETFAVSIWIQVLTVPVLCQYFYEISLYSVFVNLIILPCMGALLGLGILGGVLGCFVPFSGKLLLYPCHLALLMFDAVCSTALKLPSAALVTGKMPHIRIVLWYGTALTVFALRKYVRRKRLVTCMAGMAFALLLLAQKPAGFELDFLDVGQGDGIYLSAGDGTAAFIDGGSTDVKNVGTYRILPFLKSRGIRGIDYWFVSHCDADHISGLYEVMESGYPIRRLVAAEYMPKDEAWQKLALAAKEKNIPILFMKPGDAIRGRAGWRIRCLSPGNKDGAPDRNENSLALIFERAGLSAFFAGDIGRDTERKLSAAPGFSPVDIYKASHHGSDASNGSELLLAQKPGIAVVSCARFNSYGHPGKAAMGRLKEAGAEVFETGKQGQIKITGIRLEDVSFPVLKYKYEDD